MQSFSLTGQLLLATVLLSSQSTAQTQSDPQNLRATKEHKFRRYIEVPIISISAQVISPTTGGVIDDLTHEDFIISENNVRQEVYAWQHLPAPLSLLIVVDTAAGDANRHTLDNQVISLRSSLTDSLEIGDEVSIIAINERPIVLQDYTGNKYLINAALDRISQYKTVSESQIEERLSKGLQEAFEHARGVKNPEARRAVILIADLPGRVAERLILPETVVRATFDPETIFCWARSLNFTPRLSEVGKYSFDKVSITDLVALSGGEFVNSEWKSFLKRLRRRYQIMYLPFTRRREGQVVRIRLELKPSANRDTHDLVLSYRRFAIIPFSKR